MIPTKPARDLIGGEKRCSDKIGREQIIPTILKDLEPLIGSRARVAEVMNRKRSLSIDMIRRLHKQLGISAEVLIMPTRTGEAA